MRMVLWDTKLATTQTVNSIRSWPDCMVVVAGIALVLARSSGRMTAPSKSADVARVHYLSFRKGPPESILASRASRDSPRHHLAVSPARAVLPVQSAQQLLSDGIRTPNDWLPQFRPCGC